MIKLNHIVFLLMLIASCTLNKKNTVAHYYDIDFGDDDRNKIQTDKKEITIPLVNPKVDKLLVGYNGNWSGFLEKEKIKIVEIKNTKVIKQTNDLSQGRIVYKIPNIMRVRSTYKVLVRISKSKSIISIIKI